MCPFGNGWGRNLRKYAHPLALLSTQTYIRDVGRYFFLKKMCAHFNSIPYNHNFISPFFESMQTGLLSRLSVDVTQPQAGLGLCGTFVTNQQALVISQLLKFCQLCGQHYGFPTSHTEARCPSLRLKHLSSCGCMNIACALRRAANNSIDNALGY